MHNTAPGYTGAINYRCEIPAGASVPSLRETSRTCTPGPRCTYGVFGLAQGDTLGWSNGSGTANCAGQLPPPPAPGSSVTVTSSNGNIGTYRATCRADGTWDPTAVANCESIPTQCGPQDVQWSGAGGVQCSARTSATAYGQTIQLDSSNGNAGIARVTCNSGTWSAPFNESCSTPAQTCPAGGSMAWGSCYGNGPANAGQQGDTFTSNNLLYGYTGSGNYVCNNGVWNQVSATCDQPSMTCPAGEGGTHWGDPGLLGGRVCQGRRLPETTDGGSVTVTSILPDFDGQATFICRQGVWHWGDNECERNNISYNNYGANNNAGCSGVRNTGNWPGANQANSTSDYVDIGGASIHWKQEFVTERRHVYDPGKKPQLCNVYGKVNSCRTDGNDQWLYASMIEISRSDCISAP